MPGFLPRLADFSTAVANLGEQTTLRLKTDGSGLATTRWERFQVRFHDFLLRDKHEIALDKEKTHRVFLETVARELGAELTGVTVHEIGWQAAKLKGKTVNDTALLLTQHGGENWLQNERLIRQVAYSDAENLTEKPSLSKTTAAAQIVVSLAAKQGLLAPGDVEQLNAYIVCAEKRGKQDLSLPLLSDRIASALRQTVSREAKDGVYIDRLDADEATRIGGAMAREFMIGKINDLVFQHFEERFPLAGAVRPKLDTAALEWLSGREQAVVRGSKQLLKPEDLRAMRGAFIDGYLKGQQEKKAAIKVLEQGLPDNAVTHAFIKACAESPYVARLREIATEIEVFMARPTAEKSKEFIGKWLSLGKKINEMFPEGNALEIDAFVGLSVRLFAVQGFLEARNNLNYWMLNQTSASLVRAPIEKLALTPDTPEAASAATVLLVFDHLALFADEVDPLEKKAGKHLSELEGGGRQPRFVDAQIRTIASFAVDERRALVEQAQRKGFSAEVINTLRDMCLDAFRGSNSSPRKYPDLGIPGPGELQETLDLAVAWKAEEGLKPLDANEHDRILQFGPALVQEKITRPIIRKLNDDAYQAFLAAHPFSDDREQSMFAEHERQAIGESQELLTHEEMQVMRAELRMLAAALADPVAVVVKDASQRPAVVRLGLDATWAVQARAGAQLYERLSTLPERALLPPAMAAEIKSKFARDMAQLFEALPTRHGATLLNFSALSLAFFADSCLPEQMLAVREWLVE